MITPEIIARINALAKKQREGILSDSEKIDQAQLRRLFIDNIKAQVKSYIDTAEPNASSPECTCARNSKRSL
ncbi:MAG: DUF896 domain-containing protein [Veillonellales bacterium]